MDSPFASIAALAAAIFVVVLIMANYVGPMLTQINASFAGLLVR